VNRSNCTESWSERLGLYSVEKEIDFRDIDRAMLSVLVRYGLIMVGGVVAHPAESYKTEKNIPLGV